MGEEILLQSEQGGHFRDIAVLFRMNAQSEALERHFAALGIPYTTRRTGDFYARKEIAGMLAYLEFLSTHADEWTLRLLNVPNRKLARSVGSEMARIAEIKGKSIWDALPDFIAPDLRAQRSVRQLRTDIEHVESLMTGMRNAGEVVRAVRQTLDFDTWLRVEEMDLRDNDRIQNLQQMEEAASHYASLSSIWGPCGGFARRLSGDGRSRRNLELRRSGDPLYGACRKRARVAVRLRSRMERTDTSPQEG